MKKIFLTVLLSGTFAWGQFFESEIQEPQEKLSSHVNDNGEPDQGVDDASNPGEAIPVDNWALLLPVLGIAVAARYFYKSQKV